MEWGFAVEFGDLDFQNSIFLAIFFCFCFQKISKNFKNFPYIFMSVMFFNPKFYIKNCQHPVQINPRISNPFIYFRVYSMNPFGIGKIVWLCRIRAGSLWTFLFDDRPFHVPVKNMKAMNVKLIIRIHILLEYIFSQPFSH